MSKMIKVKRGLDSSRQLYVLELGELVWTTDNHELFIGDGLTSGGFKVTELVESNYIPNVQKAAPSGVATLDASGKIPQNQIPNIALSETWVVGTEIEQLALPAQMGDLAVRTDLNKTFIKNSNSTGSMTDWTEILSQGEVLSVNGQVGTVVLDIGSLSDVDLSLGVALGDVLQYNGTSWVRVPADTVGRTTFSALNDTPPDYTNADQKFVQVQGNSLAFTDIIDGGTFGTITPPPAPPVPPAPPLQ